MATKNTPAAPKTKRLILGCNAKGGVGKTRWAVGYVEYLRNNGHQVAAYDADGAVGGLLLTLGQRDDAGRIVKGQSPLEGVGAYDIRSEGERLELLNSVGLGADRIFHDTAGGSTEELARIAGGEDTEDGINKLLHSLERRNYRLTLVHILSPNRAATSSVARYLELFGNRADHVAVLNRFWGKEFPYWTGFTDGTGKRQGGNTRTKFLEMGGVEIGMPALPVVTSAKIEAEFCPPSVAAGDARFTIAEQDHCYNWTREFALEVEKASAFLGL